jgi:MATE family multidrug resistance protein
MINYKSEFKETYKLAYPVVIGQLGHMMMGVVDSVMVGKIGAAPLAAASVAHGLFILILIFGIGVSMALSPLVAMCVGADAIKESGNIFRQGLVVNFTLGIVLSGLTFFAADLILYLNQPRDVVGQAIAYMKTLGWSILPVMIFQTYKQTIEGLAIMRPAMLITLLANLINVFANWLFIFGNLGFPAMGLVGAGWATFTTRLLMSLTLLYYVQVSSRFKPYDLRLQFKKIDLDVIRKVLKIGVPSGVQYFFEVGAFAGSAIIIGWLGTKELAAHQIAINLASISFMFALGISAAAAIRVGNAVGRKERAAMRSAGFSAIILAGAVMGCFAVIFISLRSFLPTLYINDDAVINIAASLLVIAAIFQLSDGTQAVGVGILRGLADAKIPMIITFIAYWIIGLPGGYVLGFVFGLGVQGVWLALLIALFVSAMMLTIRFNIKSKQKIVI